MNKIGYCLWLFASTLTLPLCAEERPQDWPCEQALVHEIPAAVVWAGPSIVGLEHAWEQDKEVSRLVNRFVVSDYDQDAADAEIAEFSAEQDSSEKDSRLTLLFAGVIQTLNEERKKKLDGIIKYARGQAARANRLSHELDEMIQLQEDPSQAGQERLALMQKEMEIKQRMFDEREAFIQHLCTRPRVIEERLGSLARSIAYYLD
ncbi:MAG: hypothetical protein JAY75_17925 [Candidatus Thiodiazotropha taylori]|nr:hypothetical protein [Candidatus Thiodiazotropha taylori]MCW4226078.1 hypothetical protein [Candidatus Thiodiazotropha endolucinida]MCG7883000.1 hypothetical protein [Candidatus Thiodiazotropha taylori]MCG7887644.1 hypothetical protein [Candidatus Thiodiazotropha taylori]MCG7891250.1 hypothetical protein [Candidatus Thiodiazotropha taylori]